MNRRYIVNKKRIVALGMIVVGLLITYMSGNREDNMLDVQEGIAKKLIRFHVLANSDSDVDQELKLKVKEGVIEYIAPYLEESDSIEESREILKDITPEIIMVAKGIITEEGYDYEVDAGLKECYFPTKAYGDIVLPPGEYEAYEIEIGEAEGKNWWCILYPPLCFVDATCGIVPDSSKEMLRYILDEDEYQVITNATGENVEYSFKILDWLGIK